MNSLSVTPLPTSNPPFVRRTGCLHADGCRCPAAVPIVGSSVSVEHEIKLLAPEDLALPELTGTVPGLIAGPASSQAQDATYYDTSSLALARWGVTLRSRTEADATVWTLKVPATRGRGHALSRHEYLFAGPPGLVPVEAKRAVLGYVRSQPLRIAVRTHTERRTAELQIDGLAVAMLCDDRVSGSRGRWGIVPFRQIEVELADGSGQDVLERIRSVLIDAGCDATAPPGAKAIGVLGRRAELPPDVVVPSIGKRGGAIDLLHFALASSVKIMVSQHVGVVAGDEPEALHQFRVAIRRLRSDLKMFAEVLDPEWASHLAAELKWLGGSGGSGRDFDVLLAHLQRRSSAVPDEDRPAMATLIAELQHSGGALREDLLATLGSDRYLALLNALVAAAAAPVLAPPYQLPTPVQLARKPWRRLSMAVEAVGRDGSDDALHALRILTKRARYAVEAVEPVHGKDARDLAKMLGDIQTVLGDHHDSCVFEAWLRSTAAGVSDTQLVAGQLIALERLDRERLRKRFHTLWVKASTRGASGWLR